MGLTVQAPFGARVLSFVCCAPNDGFGVQSGLVQRGVLYAAAWGSENRPTGLRPGGRRLAVRTAMEHPIGALPRTPFPASRDFAPMGSMSLDFQIASLSCKSSSFATSRGNEKIGGAGYCVTYDTDSQSRNAPCVPFRGRGPRSGEEVDGGKNDYDTRCGRDRRRRHYKTHRPLKGKRLTTFCASLVLLHPLLSLTHWIFRSLTLPYKSSSHSAKCVRCAPIGRHHHPRPEGPPPPERSDATLLHNPRRSRAPFL